MKIILSSTQFVFTPTSNLVSFDAMGGAFKPERLLAIINTTTGKIIYSTAGTNSGLGGVFSNGTFTKSQLTYTSSNAGQSASDILEIFYEDETAAQLVSGTVTVSPQPLDVSAVPVEVKTLAADGTQILSTVDPISGGDGLNVHVQSSAYGGTIGNPIPLPNNNNALSMAFLNGSTLAAPKMDPVTNELIVQGTFSPPALQNVDLTSVDGAPIALGQVGMAQSLPIAIASRRRNWVT
jgi:hypothetical protein